jgi:hypothetical protein
MRVFRPETDIRDGRSGPCRGIRGSSVADADSSVPKPTFATDEAAHAEASAAHPSQMRVFRPDTDIRDGRSEPCRGTRGSSVADAGFPPRNRHSRRTKRPRTRHPRPTKRPVPRHPRLIRRRCRLFRPETDIRDGRTAAAEASAAHPSQMQTLPPRNRHSRRTNSRRRPPTVSPWRSRSRSSRSPSRSPCRSRRASHRHPEACARTRRRRRRAPAPDPPRRARGRLHP